MTTEEFKSYLKNSQEKDCFIYTKKSIIKIIKEADNWSKDWFLLFICILARIKKGHGTQDCKKKEGKVVCLPAGKDNYMAVFFLKHQEKQYLIYDFKIEKR
jgi:hypothetical protein